MLSREFVAKALPGIRLYCLTAILLATPFLCFLVRVLQTTAPEDWCAISPRT